MDEILGELGGGARVLDIGSASGSFPAARYPELFVARVDLESHPSAAGGYFLQGNACHLPFPDRTFDLVVSNHSLEHIEGWEGAVLEFGRVIKKGGALFLAVPDSSTVTDRLYRWLSRGGGHINAFRDPHEISAAVTALTGLPLAGTRTLYSSLSFLYPANRPGRAPRRLWLLGGGGERFLFWWNWWSRVTDSIFGSRLSVYGWAFYFGRTPLLQQAVLFNVCLRCGAGFPSTQLAPSRGGRIIRTYHCPSCGQKNPFFRTGLSRQAV